MNKLVMYAIGIGAFAAACTGPTSTVNAEIKGVMVLAEGPCFEGSNTAIGEWDFELAAFEGLDGISPDDLKNARIKSVTLHLDDEKDAGLLAELTLQLTAPATDMKKVAFLNPVPTTGSSFNLTVAETQKDLAALFKQGLVTVVADVNIRSDYDADLVLLLDIQLEFDIKN